MKKIQFISQLIKEHKIRLMEPSTDISVAYDKKSENSLNAAKVLLKESLLEDATVSAYYAMYHKLLSLLYHIGVKCENHSGAIILMKEIFDLDNRYIFLAKKDRVDKQYYVNFKTTRKEVSELIEEAERFMANISLYVDKINLQEEKRLLNKFKIAYFGGPNL